MTFTRDNFSIVRYIFKKLEIVLGLALILLVAVNEDILSFLTAGLLFVAAVLIGLPKLKTGCQELKKTRILIEKNTLIVESPTQRDEYALSDFEIILYKKSAKKIVSFVMMSKTDGVKFEYYTNMNDLFLELSQHVAMRKKIPWWQRL